MSGLTEHDLGILRNYAKDGNRELYWNYLSQLPGADGYGTLALGVVRNDSLPGRVANSYAQSYASTQHDEGSRFPDTRLSERQWEAFGRTLLEKKSGAPPGKDGGPPSGSGPEPAWRRCDAGTRSFLQ